MTSLRLSPTVYNISTMSGLLPEKEGEKRRIGQNKKAPTPPKIAQVKQILPCKQAKYDRTISLKVTETAGNDLLSGAWFALF